MCARAKQRVSLRFLTVIQKRVILSPWKQVKRSKTIFDACICILGHLPHHRLTNFLLIVGLFMFIGVQ